MLNNDLPNTKLVGAPPERIGITVIVPGDGAVENLHMLVHAGLAESANDEVIVTQAYNIVLPSNIAVSVGHTDIVPRAEVPRKSAIGLPSADMPCALVVVSAAATAMTACTAVADTVIVESVLLPPDAPKTNDFPPPRSGSTLMAVTVVEENVHTFVHNDEAETVNWVSVVAHAKRAVLAKSVNEFAEHTPIVPRLPAEPMKNEIGVPMLMPCAFAVVKTPGVAVVTEAMFTIVPVPITKYGVPTVGPIIVEPREVNEKGLPAASPCADAVVTTAVETALEAIASTTGAGCVMDETLVVLPTPRT